MLIITTLFWLLLASIIGGVILLRPISKKLGNFLEEWIAIRRMEVEGRGPETQMLAARMEALEEGQTRLLENLTFHEELKERQES
jgi:hypothetical protein